MTRALLGLAVVVGLVGAAGAAALPAQEAVLTGPIPVPVGPGDPVNDFVFVMTAMDLAGHGYVEEEYFIEGTANRYTDSGMETAEIRDGPHPFKTRFIVRRPTDPARFNGTVVVEWHNVTAGRDIDIDWLYIGSHLIHNGYAWIGVSAQRVGVDHLREWSPRRYASLDVTVGGTIEDDELSYDIFTAVARTAREPTTIDVLPGLDVERVIATGHSQSASRLAVYLNRVHPRVPVFEGAMVHGGGGEVRDDQEIRVFKLMAETDMPRRVGIRQADTDTFRQWEIAGTSHVDIDYGWERARVAAVMAGRDPWTATLRELRCDRPVYSRVPFRHAFHAAFEHLVRWVTDGTPPPTAPPLAAPRRGAAGGIFARDEHGNVLGGVQLAAHAVPTATNTGINSGLGFCRLYGSHEPFDAATLEALYPTHADYVAAVREVVEANVRSGYLLEDDAEDTIREAERSDIGRR